MSGVVERLHDGIVSLLTTDAAFIAELTLALASGGIGLPSVPQHVISNLPFDDIRQLPADQLPCWIVEPISQLAGPLEGLTDDDYGLVLMANQQAFRCAIGVGLVWSNDSRDDAKLQRLRLPDVLTRLFLRTPDAGVNGCAVCVVTETEVDQGLNHPYQNIKAVLTADIVIERS